MRRCLEQGRDPGAPVLARAARCHSHTPAKQSASHREIPDPPARISWTRRRLAEVPSSGSVMAPPLPNSLTPATRGRFTPGRQTFNLTWICDEQALPRDRPLLPRGVRVAGASDSGGVGVTRCDEQLRFRPFPCDHCPTFGSSAGAVPWTGFRGPDRAAVLPAGCDLGGVRVDRVRFAADPELSNRCSVECAVIEAGCLGSARCEGRGQAREAG